MLSAMADRARLGTKVHEVTTSIFKGPGEQSGPGMPASGPDRADPQDTNPCRADSMQSKLPLLLWAAVGRASLQSASHWCLRTQMTAMEARAAARASNSIRPFLPSLHSLSTDNTAVGGWHRAIRSLSADPLNASLAGTVWNEVASILLDLLVDLRLRLSTTKNDRSCTCHRCTVEL